MNIFKLIGELVVIYILYKLIFGFIIPLYQASKQMKVKMNDMQERMREQQKAQTEQYRRREEETIKKAAPAADDYIEYEEVK